MKKILEEIYEAIYYVIETYLFPDDGDLLPKETRNILNHPEDRKKYINACDRLKNGEESVTIELHTGKTLTLYSGGSLRIL